MCPQVLSGQFERDAGRERGRHPNTFSPTLARPPPVPWISPSLLAAGRHKLSDCSSWTRPRCRHVNIALLLHTVICVPPLTRRSSVLASCIQTRGSPRVRWKVFKTLLLKDLQSACLSLVANWRRSNHYVSSVPECILSQECACLIHHYQYPNRVYLVWLLFM